MLGPLIIQSDQPYYRAAEHIGRGIGQESGQKSYLAADGSVSR